MNPESLYKLCVTRIASNHLLFNNSMRDFVLPDNVKNDVKIRFNDIYSVSREQIAYQSRIERQRQLEYMPCTIN